LLGSADLLPRKVGRGEVMDGGATRRWSRDGTGFGLLVRQSGDKSPDAL
jgi:hypothetical protein